MDILLNELAVYKADFAKGSIDEQYNRIKNIVEGIPNLNDTSDKNGITYLIVAVCQYKVDIVKLLLENGADPNVGEKNGVRPLAHVLIKNHENREEIVRLLLEHGADPSLASKPGQTAFDFADLCKPGPLIIELLENANIKLHGVTRGVTLQG